MDVLWFQFLHPIPGRLAFPSVLSLDRCWAPAASLIGAQPGYRLASGLVNQQGFNLDVFYHGEMVTGWWCNNHGFYSD